VRRDLTPDQLGDLLDRPIVAVLATFRSNREVLLSPVWHEWRDGGFTVASSWDDVKVRHLRRDPRASIVLYESELPYRGVEVRGASTLSRQGAHEAALRIAIRYLGQEEGTAYAVEETDDVLIRLEPGQLRAWDFADEYPTTDP
jgi:PPOX class probable F420-dependent enzyme